MHKVYIQFVCQVKLCKIKNVRMLTNKHLSGKQILNKITTLSFLFHVKYQQKCNGIVISPFTF